MSGTIGKLDKFLVNQDMYGHMIGVHYRGKDVYKTRLGALVSIAMYVIMSMNAYSLYIAYRDGSN